MKEKTSITLSPEVLGGGPPGRFKALALHLYRARPPQLLPGTKSPEGACARFATYQRCCRRAEFRGRGGPSLPSNGRVSDSPEGICEARRTRACVQARRRSKTIR